MTSYDTAKTTNPLDIDMGPSDEVTEPSDDAGPDPWDALWDELESTRDAYWEAFSEELSDD